MEIRLDINISLINIRTTVLMLIAASIARHRKLFAFLEDVLVVDERSCWADNRQNQDSTLGCFAVYNPTAARSSLSHVGLQLQRRHAYSDSIQNGSTLDRGNPSLTNDDIPPLDLVHEAGKRRLSVNAMIVAELNSLR